MSENVIKPIPTELDGNAQYAIRVRSVNSFGVSSEWSDVLVVDTDSAGSANSGRITLTANGLVAYDANGQTSIIYSGSGNSVRINYAINPSFEVNTVGWVAINGGTIARSASDFYFADAATPSYMACLEVAATSAVAGVGTMTAAANRISVTAGSIYTASIYIKAVTVPASVKMGLRFYDNTGNQISETFSFSSKTINADTKWYRLSCIAARVPAGAVKMGIVILSTAKMTVGQKYRLDGCLIEQSNILGEYFDGSTSMGATKWNGTPHASTSTFDLSSSSYVDGGVFTSGTVQTAVDVGKGSPPKSGVIMTTSGLQGYSGVDPDPTFNLTTSGTLRVGSATSYMYWDGDDILFNTAGTFRVGNNTSYIFWDGTTLSVVGAAAASSISIDGDGNPATSFHVDTTGQMWLGASTFAAAPFKVTATGAMTASGVTITGASSFSGSINATSGTFTGTINANSGTFSGSLSSSAVITGGTFQTAASGDRVIISGNNITLVPATGNFSSEVLFNGSFIARVRSTTSLYMQSDLGSSISLGASLITFWANTGGSTPLNLQPGVANVTANLNVGGSTFTASGYSGLASTTSGAFSGAFGGSGAALKCDTTTNYIHFDWNGSALGIYIDSTLVFFANQGAWANWSGPKSFTINHPIDESKYLRHACAEGPTADVFYRGEGQLHDGSCLITLPDYFEALTELDGRTIQITPIYNPRDKIGAMAASRIKDGKFEVMGNDNEQFYWRVDAIRKDAKFNPEPKKSEVKISGFGPYTYIAD